ncbi:hypothetical protein [Motilimonas cestriensis]|uniref:hypothetical protein n=1 Tax=Motilimonas cestriensis TaxID=2742685 RepID=UPI003DA69F9C
MIKHLTYISVLLVGVIAGYWLSELADSIQPNYRWVQVHNESGCELTAASVAFPDRTTSVSKEQLGSSLYPHGGESDINIPVLASESDKYQVSLSFSDCPNRVGEPQTVKSGSFIQVFAGKSEIRYGAR